MHIPTAVHDRHWGLMSYPLGMCIGTKPNAAETEPSATSTEEPFEGFLISLKSLGICGLWILKWITSADNPGGQCNSGKALPTCMLLLSSHKSFYVSNNVTTPFGGHHCPLRLRHYSLWRASLSFGSVPIYSPSSPFTVLLTRRYTENGKTVVKTSKLNLRAGFPSYTC